MDEVFSLALALAVSMGTTALLANSGRAAKPTAEAQMNADGAFRDGLYLGRLAAEGGHSLPPQVGRWSQEKDRTNFVAGYRRGYNDAVATSQRSGQTRVE